VHDDDHHSTVNISGAITLTVIVTDDR